MVVIVCGKKCAANLLRIYCTFKWLFEFSPLLFLGN